MLIFKDAYQLAKAKKFIFEVPTSYNELVLRGTTESTTDWIMIKAKFIIKSEELELTQEFINYLNETNLNNLELEWFKNDFNLRFSEIENFNLEKMGFTIRNNEENEYYEYNF